MRPRKGDSAFEAEAAEVLRGLRIKAGLSHRELAAKLGCGYSTVWKQETGLQALRLVDFIAWCEALGEDPSEVLSLIKRSS